MNDLEYGLMGFGRIGGNLARHALQKGIGVVGIVHKHVPEDLVSAGMRTVHDISQLKTELRPPRTVLLYIPAGPAVDRQIKRLFTVLDAGDVIVDGGNSYWGDSIRRSKEASEQGIHFVDLGTSGGHEGALKGACFMAGGDTDAVDKVRTLLEPLAAPGGFVHAGPTGAGHFTKLVHNGIEFGMLQAFGEGVDLLSHAPFEMNIQNVLSCWRNGSVIRSWLLDLLVQELEGHGDFEKVPGFVEDTGEVNWLVTDAMNMEVPIPVISQSVMQLMASRDENKIWARAIAMIRNGFGGHPFGANASVREERQTGRTGNFVMPSEYQKSDGSHDLRRT
jgi:6-phosphogluconate dehydrogenase